MGGCATKPKVLKDVSEQGHKAPEPPTHHSSKTFLHDDAKSDHRVEGDEAQPQLQPHPQPQAHHKLLFHEIIDLDHQSNKRPSLSCLFNENEDAKVNTKSEKSIMEETVKQEASDSPVMGLNESNEGVKEESLEAKEKFLEESRSNKPEAFVQKLLKAGEKPAGECEGNDIVKQEQSEFKISTSGAAKSSEESGNKPLEAEKSKEAFKAQIGP